MQRCGLPAFAPIALRSTGGSASPVSAGFIPVDQQVLETPRHVAEFSVDQMDVAVEARRRRLIAGELADEAVVLSQDVFQAPAKVSKMRQPLRRCQGVVSVSFAF